MKKNDVLVRFATLQSVCNKKKKNGSCLESGCLCREEKCPVVFLRAQDLEDYIDIRTIPSNFVKEVYDAYCYKDVSEEELYDVKRDLQIEENKREIIEDRFAFSVCRFQQDC